MKLNDSIYKHMKISKAQFLLMFKLWGRVGTFWREKCLKMRETSSSLKKE
jgi:hypothetical protein